MPDEPGAEQPDDDALERAVVERYFAAVNARDLAAIVADLADEAEWSWPGSGEVIRGRATIEAVVDGTPNLPHVLVHRIVGGPQLVGAVWTADYGDGVPLAEYQPVRVPSGPDRGQDGWLRLGLRATRLAPGARLRGAAAQDVARTDRRSVAGSERCPAPRDKTGISRSTGEPSANEWPGIRSPERGQG